MALRRYAVTVDPAAYTTLGLGSQGAPTAVIDVDAILTDLRLPNPRRSAINTRDYPDVEALSEMRLTLQYTDSPGTMALSLSCDAETLKRYGIVIEPLTWTQEVKGVIALDSTQPEPLASPTVDEGEPPAPPPPYALAPGPLTSLLDQNGNGLNLRPLYARVQEERDNMCREVFGRNEYSATKTQSVFVVNEAGGAFSNLYRAAYTAVQTGEGAAAVPACYFTVEVWDLSWNEENRLVFSTVLAREARDKKAAESMLAYEGSRYKVTALPGGGASNPGRVAFDQNGFVRFPSCPTSFRMPNGLYWSPTYDRLTEDQIWQLTGVSGHTLSNLLRFARREISTRYGFPFDAEREPEFFRHYNARPWYLPDPSYTDERMSEAEAMNIRLLREIQSLVDS